MANPVVTAEIAFGSDPGASSPSWTDVTTYLKRASTKRGRQRLLSDFTAGTLTLILDNIDRRFDPANTSSPHYPNVIPMRRVRITALHNAITYPIFEGFIDSWIPGWLGEEAEVEVRATDAFKVFNLMQTPGPAYDSKILELGPRGFWRLNEANNTDAAADIAGDNYSGTYFGSPTMRQPDPILDGEDGAVTFDGTDDYMRVSALGAGVPFIEGTGPFTIVIVAKWSSTTPGTIIEQIDDGSVREWAITANLSSAGRVEAAVNEETGSSITGFNDSVWHLLILTREAADSRVVKFFIDDIPRINWTTAAATYAEGHQFYIGRSTSGQYFNGSISRAAIFDRELSGTERAEINEAFTAWDGDPTDIRLEKILDYAGWPSNKRNIDAGEESMLAESGSIGILEHVRAIAVAEQGALYIERDGDVRFRSRFAEPGASQATFGDGVGELPFTDPKFEFSEQEIRNEVHTQSRDGAVFVSSNESSITKYLRRVYSLTGILNDSEWSVGNIGAWIRAHYDEPTLQITNITLQPWRENSDTLWVQVLGRELEDMVTVKARPPGGGNVLDQLVGIQGISHQVTPQDWITHLDLSGTNLRDYWFLGTSGSSELGVTTRLGW